MKCQEDHLTIKRGRNAWLLARTDRDAPTRDDVIQSAGAVLKRFLGNASPLATRSIFEVVASPKGADDEGRFVIGAARPVNVTAQHGERPELPGETTDRFEDCSTVRIVAGQVPWWVVVQFDWRAPDARIPWPRRSVNALGIVTDDDTALDWLLVQAAHEGEAAEPDTTLGGEVADEVKEGAKKAAAVLKPLAWILAGAAGVTLVVIVASKLSSASQREDLAA